MGAGNKVPVFLRDFQVAATVACGSMRLAGPGARADRAYRAYGAYESAATPWHEWHIATTRRLWAEHIGVTQSVWAAHGMHKA